MSRRGSGVSKEGSVESAVDATPPAKPPSAHEDLFEGDVVAGRSSRRSSKNTMYSDDERLHESSGSGASTAPCGESQEAFLLGGLAVGELCDLLVSEDPSSRRLATEKVMAVVLLEGSGSAKISSINIGASTLAQLVTFLMRCLKKSLQARAALHSSADGGLSGVSVSSVGKEGNKIKINRADPSASLQSELSLTYSDKRSTAEILITLALDSSKTDFVTINNTITCIRGLRRRFGAAGFDNVILECLADYSKLLVTLSHAPIADFAEASAELAADVISFQGGWLASSNRLEALAVSNFFVCLEEWLGLGLGLGSGASPEGEVIARAELALGYITELAATTGDGADGSPREERLLETILRFNDCNVLRWVWALALGQIRVPQRAVREDEQSPLCSARANPMRSRSDDLSDRCLYCLSHVSVLLAVRQFLVARDAAGKLLLLLAERMDYLSKHMSEREGAAGTAHTTYVRCVLRTISNLASGNAHLSAQLRSVLCGGVSARHDDVLSMVRVGNRGLADMAADDVVVGFYYSLLLEGESRK